MPVEVFNLSAIQQTGMIPLPLYAALSFTSSNDLGVLSTGTVPALGLTSTGALSSANPAGLNVSSAGAVATVVWGGISTPPDWSTNGALVVHITGTKNTTASPTQTYGWQIQSVDPSIPGNLMSSGQTGVIASTVFHVTGSLAAASLPALNSAMTVSITTSTGADLVRINAVWLTYTRKTRG